MLQSIHPAVTKAIQNNSTSIDFSADFYPDPDPTRFGLPRAITDDDIDALVRNCINLREITLTYASEVWLERFASLPHLTRLHITEENGCLGGDWNSLRELKKLTHLSVERSYYMEENFFSNLLYLPNLISLTIVHCQHLFDDQIRYLAQVKNLQSLEIRGSSSFPEMKAIGKCVTENCLQYLLSLEQLSSLTLCGCFEITDKGWGYLGSLKNLTSLELCPDKMTKRGYESLSGLKKLTFLDLYCEITNEGLQAISFLTNLETLILFPCDQIDDKGLSYIPSLTKLKKLSLSFCRHISDEGLQAVSCLSNLNTLHLDRCTCVSEQGWKYLGTLSHLTELDLSWSRMKHGLKHFLPLSKIEYLNLEGSNFNDKEIFYLSQLKNLKSLSLAYCSHITDKGIVPLQNLTHLSRLDLRKCDNIRGETLDALASLNNLSYLRIEDCVSFTDKGVEALSSLRQFSRVYLSGCKNITGLGFRAFAHRHDCVYLDVSGCRNITDEGLQAISTMESLMHLDLEGCNRITDQGLRFLSSMPHLSHLNLAYCTQITNEGLRFISPLTQLVYLNLRCEKITDKGLVHLAPLTNLKELSLIKSRKWITDEGLKHLLNKEIVCYYYSKKIFPQE